MRLSFYDLYKKKFDPGLIGAELVGDKSDDGLLKAHQKDIESQIVHPNWWGGASEPPTGLKGWID